MRRSTRLILVLAAIVAAIGVLGYAAHSFDVVGTIARAHTPPQHAG